MYIFPNKHDRAKNKHMQKKLFYVVDNGDSSITVPAGDLEVMLTNCAIEEFNENTPEDELPVFTVSPIYMTQEEYENMPEYNG